MQKLTTLICLVIISQLSNHVNCYNKFQPQPLLIFDDDSPYYGPVDKKTDKMNELLSNLPSEQQREVNEPLETIVTFVSPTEAEQDAGTILTSFNEEDDILKPMIIHSTVIDSSTNTTPQHHASHAFI